MFKHSIIESVASCRNILGGDLFRIISELLSRSVEIYAGEWENYSNIMSKNIGRTLVFEDIFCPYKECLVSYSINIDGVPNKRAVLIGCAKEETVYYPFEYVREVRKWYPLNVFVRMTPGDSEMIIPPYSENSSDIEHNEHFYMDVCPRVLTANTILDVLSCKNVSLTPVDPPEKLNKKRIKKGKQPLYRYHVLTVDLDKGRKQSGVGRGANLGTMPVHLCRGHFKEYTTEKPLFGRVTGRFWWQPYARGKAENGVVMKDYEIKKSNV